jgi:acyl-coenzyme A thioesterase PaaI-like protein
VWSDGHFILRLDPRTGVTADGRSITTLRLGHDSRLDAGLLVLLADMVGGHAALIAGRPCSASTTAISVHGWSGLRGPGDLVATGTVLSSSRQRACVGIELATPGTPGPAAAGVASFHLFPGAFDIGDPPAWDDGDGRGNGDDRGRGRGSDGDSRGGLATSLADHAGVVADTGGAQADVHPDVANHVGSLQGGVTAALLETAGVTALAAGEVIDSVTVTYLSQGRAGPIRAEPRPRHGGGPVVVEAVDLGADRRPVAHAVLGVSGVRAVDPART